MVDKRSLIEGSTLQKHELVVFLHDYLVERILEVNASLTIIALPAHDELAQISSEADH